MRSAFVCVTAAFLFNLCGGIDQVRGAEDSATVASKPSNLTHEEIARGQAIQQLLTRGIDYAREHNGWPEELKELQAENLPAVNYSPPGEKLDDATLFTRGLLSAVLPVCNESFAKYPDGVWI